jgi:anaerobic magnesium-protoporphyrin IX monomethyl ester cyclase
MEESFKPDVVLVRPWNHSTAPVGGLVEDSLGVGYLAAALRKNNIKVVIVDAFTLQYSNLDVIDLVMKLNPKLVGFSLHSFADYKHVSEISNGLYEKTSTFYQIAGGEHASYTAQETLKNISSLNAIVISEGEQTITEITEILLSGKTPDFVMGALVRKADGSIIDGGYRLAIENLDEIPMPEKDIVETALLLNRPVALSMLSGRGCTHRCTFCTAHNFMRLGGGIVWRRRSAKLVVDELEMLYKRYYGKPGVHAMVQFQDVIFLGTSKRAREWTTAFLDEMEARNLVIPFYIMSRSDAVIAHEPQLARLAKHGLSSVEIGIETGVPRILLDYNKENSIGDLKKAIGLLKLNDICFDASGYIMFDPRMTLDELKISADFLFELGHATWDRYVTRLQIFPGTVLRTDLIANGLFDANAAIDDVYAYTFLDKGVELLSKNVYFYDVAIQKLDISIHNARSLAVSLNKQKDETNKYIWELIKLSENIYHRYFHKLISLVENGTFETEFETEKNIFVNEAREMNSIISRIFGPSTFALAS